MMHTTRKPERAISMLRDYVINGHTHEQIQEHYDMRSQSPISEHFREALALLNRYGGTDFAPSGNRLQIAERKGEIAQALVKVSIPKTRISEKTLAYLQEHYGVTFIKKAKQIGKDWDTIRQHFVYNEA